MTLLRDPLGSRVVKQLALPYSGSLRYQQVFENRRINIRVLINFLSNQGILSERIVSKIIDTSSDLLKMQPNLIIMHDPVSIIGDIHGQYYDLVKFLSLTFNEPFLKPSKKYLFLGDYVDRGLFSIQVLMLILALKINYPTSFVLLRGNHQSRQLTSYFNFKSQCLQFYNQDIYQKFIDLFTRLPLAAIVNNKYLCLHGGISTNIHRTQDIMKINRFGEIPQSGLFCDLLWADPIEHAEGKLKGLVSYNQTRGCSFYFGQNLVKRFLNKNKLLSIIRAHQAKQEGFQIHSWFGKDNFPPVFTIFSAPNYCDFYNNKGALINLENNIIEIIQFSSIQHPYHLPNNMTLFEWTIPFITEKVTQMFFNLLKPDSELKQEPVIVELIDRQRIIEELLKIQIEEAEEKMEIIKYQGKVLGDQLMAIDRARQYVLNVNHKDFLTEKNIDQINQKRPTQILNVEIL